MLDRAIKKRSIGFDLRSKDLLQLFDSFADIFALVETHFAQNMLMLLESSSAPMKGN